MPVRHPKKEFFRKLHHKKWIRVILYALMIVGVPVFGLYAHFIAVYRVKKTQLKIASKKITRPFHGYRIIQLSDIHFGPTNNSEKYLLGCIKTINSLKPDLVTLTGDFFQWDPSFIKKLGSILGKIDAKDGVIASLGNHDYGVCHPLSKPTDPISHEEITEVFSQNKIRVLHNEKIEIVREDSKLSVVGLGDLWTEHFKPHAVLQKSENVHFTLLLSHNPDSFVELKNFTFDLMLSGHAHGGQISLPFIGPPVVPLRHRHLRKGLHQHKDKQLYVNRGLGFTMKARFLSPPEIAVIELVEGH